MFCCREYQPTSRMAMLNLLKIRNIRKILTVDACKTLVQALVVSYLNYCNSILAELTDSTMKKFQRMQNIASKMILDRSKHDSTTDCMRELHWLPARSRIKHKILTLAHKSINGKAPRYLQELLEEHCPNRIIQETTKDTFIQGSICGQTGKTRVFNHW